MFCFTTQYNQNITFEKPRMVPRTRLRMSKNTGLKSEKKYPVSKFISKMDTAEWCHVHAFKFIK